jgi:uncharacterized membrane protein (UPF0127 family)
VRLINKTTGRALANEVELADTFWRRFRGLMFRRNFKTLFFKFAKPRRWSIHTFFLKFSIDVIFLDSNFFVIEVCRRLKPWCMYRPKKAARYIVELPAGTIFRERVKVGHKLVLRKA